MPTPIIQHDLSFYTHPVLKFWTFCLKIQGSGEEVLIKSDKKSKSAFFTVLHQLDQKIIYPHYDFKHLTEKYFEIGMKLNDFSIQLVKYCF